MLRVHLDDWRERHRNEMRRPTDPSYSIVLTTFPSAVRNSSFVKVITDLAFGSAGFSGTTAVMRTGTIIFIRSPVPSFSIIRAFIELEIVKVRFRGLL